MQYRPLGKTGLQIPVLSFGAGPVSTLMVGERNPQQRDVIAYAIEQGINWFDTAATYGNGQSEQNLGRVLDELGVGDKVRVASKVRLTEADLSDIRGAVRQSVEGSLKRLRLSRLTLLQLHNSITPRRGDEPTSLTPEDVLGSGGVVDAFEELREAGLVSHFGLTGIGHPESLAEVVCSGRFETMQVPYHLLNPSAGLDMPEEFSETNYGNIIATCAEMQMGVMAIRVLAGGALADNPPSPHTFKTEFFPLALYERDRQRANRIRETLGPDRRLPQEAIRFALAHSQISSAIVGFGEVSQIDEALAAIHATTPVLNWNDIRSFESNTISH
ncbi:MAG TPA: aldo/keto reductase [Planctomycetaceae bacterium]|nr:aldo/keto reductase [Planctomycetaceae bacterium]